MKKEEVKEKLKKAGKKLKETVRQQRTALIALIMLGVLMGVSLVASKEAPEEISAEAVSSAEEADSSEKTRSPEENVDQYTTEEKEQKDTDDAEAEMLKEMKKRRNQFAPAGENPDKKEETPDEKEKSILKEQREEGKMPVSVPDPEPKAPAVTPAAAQDVPAVLAQQSTPAVQEAPVPAPVTQAPQQIQEPVHEHRWSPVTVTIHHDAVTHTVHHDAVTQTVHHDAVTHEEPVYEFRTICASCGADITGHIPDHIGPVCQGAYFVEQIQTGVNIVTDQDAYDEEVVVTEAWDETVTDQAAYDDVVTTGYRCADCGAMK